MTLQINNLKIINKIIGIFLIICILLFIGTVSLIYRYIIGIKFLSFYKYYITVI